MKESFTPQRLIFGNARYADLVKDALKHFGNIDIDGYLVDKGFVDKRQTHTPQFTTIDSCRPGVHLYIGFTFQNKKGPMFLIEILRRMEAYGLSFVGFDFSDRPDIITKGKGTQIFQNVSFDIGSTVGHHTQIRPNVKVGHDVIIGDYSYIAPSVSIGSCSVIGNNCFLGYGSTIAPGTIIKEGSVIGAGVFVSGEIKHNSLVTHKKPSGAVVNNPYLFI